MRSRNQSRMEDRQALVQLFVWCMTIVLKVSLIVPFPTAHVRFSDDFYDDRHAGADPGGPNGVEGGGGKGRSLQLCKLFWK